MLQGLVQPGQTAADVGCGMGHFTLGLARLVGPGGQVLAVDLQPEMLARVQERAAQKNLADRVQLHPCRRERLALPQPVDFVLAFWMVHEVPDQRRFLAEIYDALASGGYFLIAEPNLHVSGAAFQQTVELAAEQGFVRRQAPSVWFSRAALFARPVP